MKHGQRNKRERFFDVTMGSLDIVEVCELLGIYILMFF